MIDVALPGGRVVSVRRLRGGLVAYVHAVRVVLPDGTRTSVVLRRDAPDGPHATTEQAVAEYRLLGVLNEAAVPAPRPLLLDADGRFLGSPAILMSDAGRPLVSPRNAASWLAELADALATLATVTPDRFDLSFLKRRDGGALRGRAERPLPASLTADTLACQVSAALMRYLPPDGSLERCLVHCDFWPGNTVWRRERLSAVIDWSSAAIGDPRIDLAQCRVDLAMMHGPEMADAFLSTYRARSGKPVRQLRFFDLLCGISALDEFRDWLRGYHDIGLTHLREETVEERVRLFLGQVLSAEC